MCHTSLFEKILGSWYPEFIQIHGFMGIHETKQQARRFKTLFVSNFILLTART